MTDTSYKVQKIDPKNLADEQWNDYLDHYEALHWEEFPNYPDPGRQVRKQEMKIESPFYIANRWFVYVQNVFIGYAFLGYENQNSPSYETNKHQAEAYISLNQNKRRKGIGSKIFHELIQKAREAGKSKLTIWTCNPTGKNFSKKLGGKLVHEHFVNKLELIDVDLDLMRRWITESQMKTPEIKIECYNDIPDDIIEEFVVLHTETNNQAPWGGDSEERLTVESRRQLEKMFREEGIDWITMVSIEQNGEISGLTEMMFNPNEPTSIQQELTGVRDKYRGRGLGKRLKAEMLMHVKNKYPTIERVSTGNAKANDPMLHINKLMGFKEQTVFHLYEFDI